MTSTAHLTNAGEALRAMLPAGSDPYSTIDLAGHLAFLARDRQLLPELVDVVKTMPDLAAGLLVTLAAMVDVDSRPSELLHWLGTHEGRQTEALRSTAALAEARQEWDDASADTLPPVTLESMREMAHVARLARVKQPCGTIGAHSRHLRDGKDPCPRCVWARWLYDNATAAERRLMRMPLVGCAKHPNGDGRCKACKEIADEAAGRKLSPAVIRPQCGQRKGYELHRYHHEERCTACRLAQREYDAQRAARHKATAATGTVHPLPGPAEERREAAA
jgi:hypothetical protein